MKKIKLQDYNKSMGTLIDLSSTNDFLFEFHPDALNIPYHKFMLYYDRYLTKDKPYFITCSKGVHSAKMVSMLEYFGYNVTQAIK